MAATGVYQLTCTCGKKLELPVIDPQKPETFTCPACNDVLRIEWGGVRERNL